MTRLRNSAARLRKLSVVLESAKTMLIVMQNNPDPDAIAAAAGLREIANELHGISCSVVHAGTVGRAENVALVKYLGLNTRPVEKVDVERFDRIAMVDAQPGAGNVKFNPDIRLDVVIDHHPIRRETRSARFTDVRSRYGATSTILYEYLRAAHLDVPTSLATALVYGIRSDTQDLGRESTRADVDAFLDLYPSANARALGRIVSAPLPRTYFSSLREALSSARLHGHVVVAELGELDSPDMVAETADLLLRVEGVSWSMCIGEVDRCLHISLRSTDREGHAGRVARNLGGRLGFGGGHQSLAAAQIPIDGRDRTSVTKLVRGLKRRFLRATDAADSSGEPLAG